jgi:hypothetical protein
MSNSSAASTESLLYKGEVSHARSGGKAVVFLAFALGLGLGAMIAVTTSGGQMNESALDMAWQSTRAQPAQSMMPVKSLPVMQHAKAFPVMQSPVASANPGAISRATGFRTNALVNPSALTGPGLSQNGVPDIRNSLGFSPTQKCVYANQHASLCGNIVVLRPSTALRATSDKDSQSIDAEQILKDLSEKWDAVEDKTTVALYGGGALVALYLTNGILSTVNGIPLLPGLLETVGLGYSGYFAYRYLLTKSSREELVADIDELKKKISG